MYQMTNGENCNWNGCYAIFSINRKEQKSETGWNRQSYYYTLAVHSILRYYFFNRIIDFCYIIFYIYNL